MAKPKKIPTFEKVKLTNSGPPQAPWRAFFDVEDEAGRKSRKFKSFSTLAKCITFAEEKNTEVLNHGKRFGDIPPEVRRCFDAYRDKEIALTDKGITLPPFEELVSDAIKRIVDSHEAALQKRVSIADAVADFNAYKKTRVGARQAQDYRTRLKRFALVYGTSAVDEITAATVESWLSEIKSRQGEPLGVIARNNLRATIGTLFEFCRKKGWCQTNVMRDVEREKPAEKEPLAYSPAEAKKILLAALKSKSPALPSLVLGFFAGLRVSETLHIDLARIDLSATEFRVPVSKTGVRMAPLLPAAAEWLAVCPRQGKAWDGSIYTLMEEVRAVRKAAKVRRIVNGPRHSFITYRAAGNCDVGKVADECGNSVQMVKDSYRAIVTESVGTTYFENIRPPATDENIIQLRQA